MSDIRLGESPQQRADRVRAAAAQGGAAFPLPPDEAFRGRATQLATLIADNPAEYALLLAQVAADTRVELPWGAGSGVLVTEPDGTQLLRAFTPAEVARRNALEVASKNPQVVQDAAACLARFETGVATYLGRPLDVNATDVRDTLVEGCTHMVATVGMDADVARYVEGWVHVVKPAALPERARRPVTLPQASAPGM